ncbi:hypothetical protein [Janibacter anophelis]|uniref:hypothetical protein n=1 Tax=Janibacter anophelis TaxID=319054 RepID=UPI000B0473C6|nr:hypothetical protein [Janibacter anophelis]
MAVQEAGDEVVDLVTMGCAWTLDLSALPAAAAAEMRARWGRCAALAADPTTLLLDDEPHVLRVGLAGDGTGATVVAGDLERLPYVLSREITRLGLTRLRGRVTLLHAAALADADGRAVVLVAPSGGGKSTATSVLGHRLGYVTDESVVLRGDGRIAPHPKPPSLIIDPAERWHKAEPSPDESGLGPTPPAPRIAALLTLARDPAVTTSRIEPVGLVDQLLAVLPETSSTWWLDDGLDRLARAVTAGGAPARLVYAEVDTCHELVAEHLAQAARVEPTWEHLPPRPQERLPRDEEGSAPEPTPRTAHSPGEMRTDQAPPRVVRAPWSDAIACDGEVLVLAGARPLRLAGPGAVVWRAAGEPVTVAELTAAVVAELGEHPEANRIVGVSVADLLDHEVLRRVVSPAP